MTEIAKRIGLLIGKHLKQELTEEERQELNTWIEESEDNRIEFEKLTNAEYLENAIRQEYKRRPVETTKAKLEHLIQKGGQQQRTKIWSLWLRISVAAAVVILIGSTAVLILSKNNKGNLELVKTSTAKPDITPGTYKATLKLADGRSIVLDSATTGQLAQQGGTEVLNKNGELVYSGSGDKGEVLWNTLSTSKGQTYPLLLADGSRVTLNSESSISFPVAFAGNLREVKVTGEVFFEVAHNAAKPFKVIARDMELLDLGTTFNVNAYPDEGAVKATLVEGSILVKKGVEKKIIKPGQQAEMLPNEIKVTETNIDKITAWKRGLFLFTDDKLSEAMKNIARWYDIDVMFESGAANVDVSGTIPRSANLSELVKLLSLIDVDARIEGRKLILKAK